MVSPCAAACLTGDDHSALGIVKPKPSIEYFAPSNWRPCGSSAVNSTNTRTRWFPGAIFARSSGAGSVGTQPSSSNGITPLMRTTPPSMPTDAPSGVLGSARLPDRTMITPTTSRARRNELTATNRRRGLATKVLVDRGRGIPGSSPGGPLSITVCHTVQIGRPEVGRVKNHARSVPHRPWKNLDSSSDSARIVPLSGFVHSAKTRRDSVPNGASWFERSRRVS